jgi:cell fate regulator YaaT (PSP1 superfamily)
MPDAQLIVRHGRMRFLGLFDVPDGQAYPRGQAVVVGTDRGLELGEVLCPASERAAHFLDNPTRGAILRVATEQDVAAARGLEGRLRDGFTVCRELIAQKRLQMDLVDVELILGGERMVFYFLAEKRVDFRELVKDLARTFRTRIEMRQIGIRDEAKLLADYGDCGKPVCCNTHLTRMPPVSMRMAKIQKTTLDPSKISGRCGRLKCCLRYEFDHYEAVEQELPSVGSWVTTRAGRGRVTAQEILARKLVVEYDDHRRIIVAGDEVLAVEERKPRKRRPPSADDPQDDSPV